MKLTLKTLSSMAALAVGMGLGLAQAADLPTRKAAPAPVVVAAPSWTGFYLGAEAGLDWNTSGWNTTGLGPGFVVDNTASTNFTQFGGRVGLYGGYNWQFSPTAVAGVEANIAGDFLRSKSQTGIPGTLTNFAGAVTDRVSSGGSNFDASLRARLGYLVTPSTMIYGTGGIAFANPKYSINCPSGATSWCAVAESGSSSPVQVGWTLGAGVETQVWRNWLARLEYRYSGFGGKNTTFFPNGGVGGSDQVAVRTRFSTNTISLGLAYKF